MAHVTRGCCFLLGGTKILRSLKFTTEENRLSDSAGEGPDERIERADGVEVRGSESATGAKHKARQSRGASLVHAVKGSGETAFTGDEVGPAFENLRRQTGGHGSRLIRERTSHVKLAGRIMTRDDFNRADRLRPHLLCGVKRVLCGGGARRDLGHVKVTREPLLLLHIREF